MGAAEEKTAEPFPGLTANRRRVDFMFWGLTVQRGEKLVFVSPRKVRQLKLNCFQDAKCFLDTDLFKSSDSEHY